MLTSVLNFSVCSKTYKTHCGLERHYINKHTTEHLSSQSASKPKIQNLELKVLIEKCVSKLAVDKCFSEDHRLYFKNFTISSEQCIPISELFKEVFNDFGNQEKFYTKFYKISIDNFVFNNFNLPEFLSRLLCTELSNACLDVLMNGTSGDFNEILSAKVEPLSPKDLGCVEYLSAYYFHKKYSGLRHKKIQSGVCSQWLDILLAVKVQDGQQKLVEIKNRGGLWEVHCKAVDIFKICEVEFRKMSSTFINKIDSAKLTAAVSTTPIVKTNFHFICSMAEQEIDKEISHNLLNRLLHLYMRVHSHSYAKKIKEDHKQQKKAHERNLSALI